MDDKTIQKNLQTSIILFVLCLIVTIAAALLQWTEITIAMGVLAVVQAYIIYVWWHRKRHRKPHFQHKPHERA